MFRAVSLFLANRRADGNRVDKPPGCGRWRPVVRLAIVGALAILTVVAVVIDRINGRLAPLAPVSAPVVSGGLNADIEQQIHDILQARDLDDAQRKYRILFKAAGVDELRALRLHHQDGIALQAAWEEVVLTVPEDPKLAERPEKLEWFLSFLQRRLRSRPPEWWTDMLLDARANGRHNIYFPSPKERPYHGAGLNRFAPRGTTLNKTGGGKIVLTIGDQSAAIPQEILLNRDSYRFVSGLITPTRCYVAVHSVGLSHQLFCIDRGSAKVLWKTDVWAAGNFHGVPPPTWVAVREQNGRIVVFGAGGMMIYVEAFRANTGANLFRFAGGSDRARLRELSR